MVVFSTVFAPISTPDLGHVPMIAGGVPFSTLTFIGVSEGEPQSNVFPYTFPITLS
jgi:hypothetical protein